MDAVRKMQKARTHLLFDQPFFGTLALKLKLIEKNDLPHKTMATNGVDLKFDSDFVGGISLSVCKSAIAHEVMHLACSHHTRLNGREHTAWNIAADYTVNNILKEAGFEIPANWYSDPNKAHMNTDEIYAELIRHQGQGAGGGQLGMTGSGQGPGQNPGQGQGMIDPGQVQLPPSPSGQDQPTKSELQQNENDWKVATAQALQADRNMGKISGELRRIVEGLLAPKVNWRELLQNFIERVVHDDYTFTRPNMRYIQSGVYLPSLYSKDVGKIAFAVDTSGSISEKELEQFASEINTVLETFNPEEVNVHYVDSKLQHIDKFTKDDVPLKLNMHGGGGTSFAPAFEHIKESGDDPICLVYLTDMCSTDFPDFIPDYPVLWINTEKKLYYNEPPFGEVTFMNGKDS